MSDAGHDLYIVSGVNEAPFLGEGWYGRERFHGGITGRQIGRRGEILVDLRGADTIAITYVAHSETVGHPIHGALMAGEFLLGRLNVAHNAWKTSRFHVPEALTGGALALETHNPWCPDDVFHDGDGRLVGLVVSAIRIHFTGAAEEPAKGDG